MKKNKGIYITKEKFMSLVQEIISENQKELKDESFSSDIMLMDLLASTQVLLKLKKRIFEDYDEE